jgi:hypothetical protein
MVNPVATIFFGSNFDTRMPTPIAATIEPSPRGLTARMAEVASYFMSVWKTVTVVLLLPEGLDG